MIFDTGSTTAKSFCAPTTHLWWTKSWQEQRAYASLWRQGDLRGSVHSQ